MELRKCVRCGKEYAVSTKRVKRYCSENCRKRHYEHRERLKLLPSGGKRRIMNRLKSSLEYQEWRQAVVSRDGFKCQLCGQESWLHAHHIVKIADDLEQVFNVDNGITLCATCHTIVHGYYITPKADLSLTTDQGYCMKMRYKYKKLIAARFK